MPSVQEHTSGDQINMWDMHIFYRHNTSEVGRTRRVGPIRSWCKAGWSDSILSSPADFEEASALSRRNQVLGFNSLCGVRATWMYGLVFSLLVVIDETPSYLHEMTWRFKRRLFDHCPFLTNWEHITLDCSGAWIYPHSHPWQNLGDQGVIALCAVLFLQ